MSYLNAQYLNTKNKGDNGDNKAPEWVKDEIKGKIKKNILKQKETQNTKTYGMQQKQFLEGSS